MARTFKGLYPGIYDFDNLWLAWRRARRGGKRNMIHNGFRVASSRRWDGQRNAGGEAGMLSPGQRRPS